MNGADISVVSFELSPVKYRAYFPEILDSQYGNTFNL